MYLLAESCHKSSKHCHYQIHRKTEEEESEPFSLHRGLSRANWLGANTHRTWLLFRNFKDFTYKLHRGCTDHTSPIQSPAQHHCQPVVAHHVSSKHTQQRQNSKSQKMSWAKRIRSCRRLKLFRMSFPANSTFSAGSFTYALHVPATASCVDQQSSHHITGSP